MAETESVLASEIQVFFIYLKFHTDFSENDDPIILLRRLRELGKVTVIPHTSAVPPLEEYEPDKLYIQWTVKLSTEKSQADIEKLLESVIADSKNSVKIEQITLPPPDPGILNQATEEKLLSTAPAVKKMTESQTIDNTWFKVGRNIFTLENECIVESVQIEKINTTAQGEKTIKIQDDIVHLLSLHHLLHLPQTQDLQQMVVLLVKQAEKRYGLLVDEVIPPIAVDKLVVEAVLSQQPYISGATLLENDEIAFKLDVSQLVSKEA